MRVFYSVFWIWIPALSQYFTGGRMGQRISYLHYGYCYKEVVHRYIRQVKRINRVKIFVFLHANAHSMTWFKKAKATPANVTFAQLSSQSLDEGKCRSERILKHKSRVKIGRRKLARYQLSSCILTKKRERKRKIRVDAKNKLRDPLLQVTS